MLIEYNSNVYNKVDSKADIRADGEVSDKADSRVSGETNSMVISKVNGKINRQNLFHVLQLHFLANYHGGLAYLVYGPFHWRYCYKGIDSSKC